MRTSSADYAPPAVALAADSGGRGCEATGSAPVIGAGLISRELSEDRLADSGEVHAGRFWFAIRRPVLSGAV